jgi:hypothetical protein
MEIKPFSELPLIKFFQHDLEKIKMAFRLSDVIRKDVKNIRAAGDEVEFAVKDFFNSKLYPKYHVCDGHIVDSSLKISPQYDLIVSENSKNPVLFNLADKSELVYFESVFAFAEIKKSLYSDDLIEKFSKTIERQNQELKRDEIPPNYIETGNTGIQVEDPLTSLPLRNPVLKFLFFVDGSRLDSAKVGKFLSETNNRFLPNYIVFLDIGIVLNVCKKSLDKGNIRINLYPEYETEENIWVLLDLDGENNVLIYQYLLLIEHLNSCLVGTPSVRKYTDKLFGITLSNFHKL